MSIKSLGLLILQFLTMGYLVSGYTIPKNTIVIIVQIIAIAIALWGIFSGGIHSFNAQPEVKSDRLITNGPFKWIRNPMYLGILMFFSSDTIQNSSMLRWIAFCVLALTLLLKIYSEERFLKEKFKTAYTDYKSKTYRLIPFVY